MYTTISEWLIDFLKKKGPESFTFRARTVRRRVDRESAVGVGREATRQKGDLTVKMTAQMATMAKGRTRKKKWSKSRPFIV
jgi:hypothetical protein